jgi:hypothetical protein
VYTLVNAPVLGFDLARRDGGHLVADVIVRSLCLTAEDIPALAAAHRDDAGRDSAWLELAVEERSTVPTGCGWRPTASPVERPPTPILSSLERLAGRRPGQPAAPGASRGPRVDVEHAGRGRGAER